MKKDRYNKGLEGLDERASGRASERATEITCP